MRRQAYLAIDFFRNAIHWLVLITIKRLLIKHIALTYVYSNHNWFIRYWV